MFYRCNSRVYIISPLVSTASGRPSHKLIWHHIHMGPFHTDPFHFMAHLEWCRLNVLSLYWNKFCVSYRTKQTHFANTCRTFPLISDFFFVFVFDRWWACRVYDVPRSFVQMLNVFHSCLVSTSRNRFVHFINSHRKKTMNSHFNFKTQFE